MPDIMNQPVNPYPQPTEKLEDREGFPFAGPFRSHPDHSHKDADRNQLALDFEPDDRKVPRYA